MQIYQLFAHLISNALKFNASDRTLLISVTAHRATQEDIFKCSLPKVFTNYHKISIVDNGIGFSQSSARQIFDLFRLLHSKNEYQGNGIGLPMCKKICQTHSGDIYAESTLGEHASFHVILPSMNQ